VWYHGGVAFAPKPRDYSYTLNKKVKRLAMKSALSAKAAEAEIVVIDGLKLDEIKTKAFKSFLNKIGVDGKALVVTENVDEVIVKSARNIAGVTTTIASILSPYMILTSGKMIVDKAALAKIEEVYA
jgi:large subunit ribosomal protein L4